MVQARDQSPSYQAYRIAASPHHDGDCLCCLLRLESRPSRLRDDDVHLQTGQLGRELREPIGLPFRKSEFDGDVLSVNISEFLQPFRNARDLWGRGPSGTRNTAIGNLSWGPSPAAVRLLHER